MVDEVLQHYLHLTSSVDALYGGFGVHFCHRMHSGVSMSTIPSVLKRYDWFNHLPVAV
jgi:hypothetical protein